MNIHNRRVTVKDRKLIIMRGLPGSGKSEKAKRLLGNGIIHSTDEFFLRAGYIYLIMIILAGITILIF